MLTLSSKQRRILEREALVLRTARKQLLERGYYGLTMERVAVAAEVPKGTMYQRFACKEDIILALARQALERRLSMMRRAMGFEGRSREQVLAVGEAVTLFTRECPGDASIMYMATGPIREKASPERVRAVIELEHETIDALLEILGRAVSCGDLELRHGTTLEEIAFATWSMVDGGFLMIQSGIPRSTLSIADPFMRMFRAFHTMADGYGWRPLFEELDWRATLERVRREVFPDEAQAVYGPGNWRGDDR